MENDHGRSAAAGQPQQKRFMLSEGAIETLGATLLLTVIGFIGYTMYTWIWSFAN